MKITRTMILELSNTVIPKAQVSFTGFEDNPLRGGVKLAPKGA